MRRALLLAALIAVSLCVLMAGSGLASASILLGSNSVASSQDENGPGQAEAFKYSASASGSAQSISVYVDSGSSAGGLAVGLYADSNGHPSSLLASGSTSAPAAGQWNDVTLTSTPTLSSGTTYWLALLGTGGRLNFRDAATGSCSENPSQSVTNLPPSWTSGMPWPQCSLSAYVNGTASATSGSSTSTSAPASIALPTISGTPQQGQALTGANGTWSNSPSSYTYAWQDCDSLGSNCVNIAGASSSSYALQASDVGDTIRFVVTAANSTGSGSASSVASSAVSGPPPAASFVYAPAGPLTGETVHFDGTASTCPATPCSYTWADNPPGGGSWPLGTGQAIDFTFHVVGTKYVTLTVTDALNRTASAEHNVVVMAAPPVAPPAPANTAVPAVSGTPQQGQTLTGTNGTWSNSPSSYTYAWQDCDSSGSNCVNIAGASSTTYALQASDVGDTIRLVVRAVNAGGSSSASSLATSSVSGPPPAASFVYAPAGPMTGQTVHFDGTASTCPATPCSYTWADDPPTGGSTPLGSGQAIDFTFQAAGAKYVTLSITDARNRTASVEHNVVVTAAPPVTPPAPANSALPTISGTPQQGQTLAASMGTWSGNPTSYTYQWQEDGTNNIAGATTSSYTAQASDVGHSLDVVVQATNPGGSASASSVATGPVTAGGGTTGGGTTGGGSCTVHVPSPSGFAQAFSAAGAGAVLCLAPGDYGTFTGDTKSSPGVTITPDISAGGKVPALRLGTCQSCAGSGDISSNVVFSGLEMSSGSFVTFDGVTFSNGGTISGSTNNVTIRNSNFTGSLDFDGLQNANILLDHDGFDWDSIYDGGANGKITFHYGAAGSSGVTVSNSLLSMGNLDGIHTGVAFNAINNIFKYICDDNTNHTDQIQFEGAVGGRISGNYMYAPTDGSCGTTGQTQGISSYDGNTQGVLIENNAIDISRTWCIEMYADNSSVIRHNTCVVRSSGCDAGPCGVIDVDTKVAGEGSGTRVYDNVARQVTFSNGATGTEDHNLCAVGCGGGTGDILGLATMLGGATPSDWAGFCLVPNPLGILPLGIGKADDGSNMGVLAGVGGTCP